MSLDPTWLFLSMIPSGIGFVLFVYGKKQDRGIFMLAYTPEQKRDRDPP